MGHQSSRLFLGVDVVAELYFCDCQVVIYFSLFLLILLCVNLLVILSFISLYFVGFIVYEYSLKLVKYCSNHCISRLTWG